ncbi:MAG TPA: hypothetical protein VM689_20635 [Aliidongia sp.]|nr:hypothetical protein [Aliidongia sp.]
MADISDARQALAQIIAGLIYPAGVPAGTMPSAAVIGAPVRIYAGSPEREALDADLAAGIVNITVETGQDGVNTTRFPAVDQVISVEPPSLSWVVAGIGATLCGAVATPQNAGLLVDGKAYLYAVQPADTLETIGAALAALVAVDQAASAEGATIVMPNSHRIVGRIGTVGRTLREVGREIITVHVSVWAPSPTLRQAAAAAFEPNLRDLRRFPLPDDSIAQIWAERSNDEDRLEKAALYRRNALYKLEYASTIAGTASQILSFTENVAAGAAPAVMLAG